MTTENKKDLITIIERLDTSLHVFDKLSEKIVSGKFFDILYKENPDIITHYHRNNITGVTTLFVKNLIDSDDEELGILCFTLEISKHSTSITITGIPNNNYHEALISLETIDTDNTNIIHFESFTVQINPSTLHFAMKYDSTRHPSYMGKMIEKYFEKIFSRFSIRLSDPLFLY